MLYLRGLKEGQKMCIYIFSLLLVSVFSFEMPPDWINPADIHHYRRIHNLKQSTESPTDETSTSETIQENEKFNSTFKNTNCSCPSRSYSACDSYFKRVINLLLIESQLKNYRLPKDDSRIIPLRLYFTSESLETLHKFASEEGNDLSWSDFDAAFSSLFDESNSYSEQETRKDYPVIPEIKDYSYLIFVMIVGSMLICGLWLLLKSGSLINSLIAVFVIFFAVALVWNLIRAYNIEKEKLIQRSIGNPSSNDWLSFLKPLARLWPGTKTERLLTNDPLVNVDFGDVFMETLCIVFDVFPRLFEKLGEALDKFYDAQGLIGKISQFCHVLLSPIILIFLLLVLIIFYKDISIRLPFFSLALENNRNSERSEPENVKPVTFNVHQKALPITKNPVVDAHNANIAMSSHTAPAVQRVIHEFYTRENKFKDNPGRPPAVLARKGRVHKRKRSAILGQNKNLHLDVKDDIDLH